MDAGVADRGHRLNLMSESYREVGIGAESGIFKVQGVGYNAAMLTQDFGKTDAQPSSFLVGVAFHDSNGNGFYNPGEGLPGLTVTPSAGTYYAVTSDSGGFAIPLSAASGTLTVTFSGGGLSGPVDKSVVLTGQNVKLDLNTAVDMPAISLANPRFLPNGQFTFRVVGPGGASVVIQSSDNLVQWSDRQTLVLNASSAYIDTQTTSSAHRSYRVKHQ